MDFSDSRLAGHFGKREQESIVSGIYMHREHCHITLISVPDTNVLGFRDIADGST